MSGWGDFDDNEEWDAAPAVVQKKKPKKKAEAHSGEWDDAHAPVGQKGAARLSTLSSTAAATAASGPPAESVSVSQQQQQQQQQQPADSNAAEAVDMDALQQMVSELDAQLAVEEQDRLIREALLAATDNPTIFDLKEMHGNVLFILGRRDESAQAFADCITCFEGMAPDVRDEKADEMMLLNATLVALHASCGNSSGVDQSVSYLQSVGIARAEAEEVGTINFKALEEAATHFTSKQENGHVPAEWVAKMNSNWAKCVSRGRTVYVHLENDTMTLVPPPEGVQYEEGVFSSDFEPIWAKVNEESAATPAVPNREHVQFESRLSERINANSGNDDDQSMHSNTPACSEKSTAEEDNNALLRKQLEDEKTIRAELEEQAKRDAEATAWQKEELDQMRDRASKAERRVKALQKERDTMRRAVESKDQSDEVLREKEEQVNGLLAEGERMSRQLGEKETLLRKARAQMKELEVTNTALKDRLEATEAKLSSLQEAQEILASTEKAGKKEIVDQAKQNMSLAAQTEEQERMIEKLRRDNIELQEQLETATEEVKAHMLLVARAEENVDNAATEAQEQAKSELSKAAEVTRRQNEEREEVLTGSIDELRAELDRAKREHHRQEDRLAKELRDAERREVEAEHRCQDLERMVPEATRPLLRQIDALQKSQDERAAVWQELENNFQRRIQAAEASTAIATEKANAAADRLSSETVKVAQLHERYQSTETERTSLVERVAQLEGEKRAAEKERTELRAAAVRDSEVRVSAAVDEERRLWLTKQADWEEESRRTMAAVKADHDAALQEAESKYVALVANHSAQLATSESIDIDDRSAAASVDSAETLQEQTDASEGGLFGHESVHANMRQRERGLRALQTSLTQAEATNAALAEELVSLTRKNDEAMLTSKSSQALEQELDSLQARHAAALEILGEKDEQLQAAQEDLLDIKTMYKELLHERFGE